MSRLLSSVSRQARQSRRVFLVGGWTSPFIGKSHPDFIHKKHPDFGKRENPTLEDYITNSVNAALKTTGVKANQIQKGWLGNFAGELFSSQGHLGAALVGAHPDLRFLPSARVEAACASGGIAFNSAVTDIRAGLDIVLVAGAEVQNTVSARQGGDYLARASHYAKQRSLDDFTFPALFARRMRAYLQAYSLTHADIAHVAVKAYAQGNLNPLAHMQAVQMTLERASRAGDDNPAFLGNPELKEWLKISDCSQVSDGGSALIVASEEGLARIGKKPEDCVEIAASTIATDNLYKDGDPLAFEATKAAAARAYAEAGVTANDIQVAEVHDCFSIAEILMYEALGFAKKGEGWKLAKEGHASLNGRIPVNTGGGLLAFGHPVGATGVKQILEIFRQMKGECGQYQMKTRPTIGVAANMGGDDKTAVVSILKTVA